MGYVVKVMLFFNKQRDEDNFYQMFKIIGLKGLIF